MTLVLVQIIILPPWDQVFLLKWLGVIHTLATVYLLIFEHCSGCSQFQLTLRKMQGKPSHSFNTERQSITVTVRAVGNSSPQLK